MKNIKYKSILSILIYCLIFRSLCTDRQKIFEVSYWDKYIYSIIIICILFLLIFCKKKIEIKHIKLILLFLTPFIMMYLYTLFLYVVNPDNFNNFNNFIARATSVSLMPCIAILEAFCMFIYFGKNKAINITFYAYVSNYFLSMIVAIKFEGISSFYRMIFDDTYSGSVLEMSELLPAIPIFLIFYLFSYIKCDDIKNKRICLFKIIICLFIMIIGLKRILIISLMVIMLIYFLFKLSKSFNNVKRTKYIILCIFFFVIFIVYTFVYMIKSGTLFYYLYKYGINTMARTQFWEGMRPFFDFKWSYMGHGMGFVSKWMDYHWKELNIIGLTDSTGIHSDVLKYYIDLGFIPFFLLLYFQLVTVSKKIINYFSNLDGIFYFIIMIFQILCWFTDNVSIYHIFLLPLYLTVLPKAKDSREGLKYD